MKILIAVPTYETISAETFKSIYDLDTGDHDVAFDFTKGYDCAKARNEIAKKAVSNRFDYVLMVDSDIILPEDTLTLMTENPTDILLGCYLHGHKDKAHDIELFKYKQGGYEQRYKYTDLPHIPRVIVKGGGFGCAFVKVDVFRNLEYPWFKFQVFSNGDCTGEDIYFCQTAMSKGYKVYADTRVRCGHLQKYFLYE